MKLQNEMMKLENDKMKLENDKRASVLREQEMKEKQHMREEERRQSETDAAMLKKPRDELVQQAQTHVAHAPPNEDNVLKEFETRGFKFYSCPVYFVAEADLVEQVANDALQELPPATRAAVARLLANTEQTAGAKTIYEYADGNGELTKLVYKVGKTGSKKAAALMPFGASFQCSRFVKSHKTIKEKIPIFEDQPKEQLDSKGWMTHTYKTVYERKQVGERTIERKEPIFDEKVLSIDQQTEMMNALETRASRKVLKEIGTDMTKVS